MIHWAECQQKPTQVQVYDWSKCRTLEQYRQGGSLFLFDDLHPNGLLISSGFLPSGCEPPKRLNTPWLDPLGLDVHIRETHSQFSVQWQPIS